MPTPLHLSTSRPEAASPCSSCVPPWGQRGPKQGPWDTTVAGGPRSRSRRGIRPQGHFLAFSEGSVLLRESVFCYCLSHACFNSRNSVRELSVFLFPLQTSSLPLDHQVAPAHLLCSIFSFPLVLSWTFIVSLLSWFYFRLMTGFIALNSEALPLVTVRGTYWAHCLKLWPTYCFKKWVYPIFSEFSDITFDNWYVK